MYIFLTINLTFLTFIIFTAVFMYFKYSTLNKIIILKDDEITKLTDKNKVLSNRIKILESKPTELFAFVDKIIEERIRVIFSNNLSNIIYGKFSIVSNKESMELLSMSICNDVFNFLNDEVIEAMAYLMKKDNVKVYIMETVVLKLFREVTKDNANKMIVDHNKK